MNNTIAVQVIHAKDADQHLGYLSGILENLKKENRIGSYSHIAHDTVTDSQFETLGEEDMVVTMLTKGLIGLQVGIEQTLIAVKQTVPKYKMVEIIVDNVPYHPDFIALPSSLEPIRDSENMDAVWQGIEEKFKVLFPAPTPAPVPPVPAPSTWKKYLPYIFGLLALLCIVFVLFKYLGLSDVKIAKKAADTTVEVEKVSEKAEFIVEDVFSITGRGTVATGKVIKGTFKKGDQLYINDSENPIMCTGIEKFRKITDVANEGDEVGLLLRGITKNDVKRGDKIVIR